VSRVWSCTQSCGAAFFITLQFDPIERHITTVQKIAQGIGCGRAAAPDDSNSRPGISHAFKVAKLPAQWL
jgi:hypothetical protein